MKIYNKKVLTFDKRELIGILKECVFQTEIFDFDGDEEMDISVVTNDSELEEIHFIVSTDREFTVAGIDEPVPESEIREEGWDDEPNPEKVERPDEWEDIPDEVA